MLRCRCGQASARWSLQGCPCSCLKCPRGLYTAGGVIFGRYGYTRRANTAVQDEQLRSFNLHYLGSVRVQLHARHNAAVKIQKVARGNSVRALLKRPVAEVTPNDDTLEPQQAATLIA